MGCCYHQIHISHTNLAVSSAEYKRETCSFRDNWLRRKLIQDIKTVLPGWANMIYFQFFK